MGRVSREKGLLKLVRPGGIVELHKHPITAAQVMEKYPRHCVTRPDVFKFPYIVVRPESVLTLGRVFFIVPCYTIRRLLQIKGYAYHLHRPPRQCEDGVHSLAKEYYHGKQEMEYNQPLIEPNTQTRLIKETSDKALDLMENFDPSFFHHMIIPDNQRDQKKKMMLLQSRQMKERDYDSGEAISQSCFFPLRKKGGGSVEASKGGATSNNLKPCLKKHRSSGTRSRQGLRVRFKFPDEDDDYQKWDTDFSDF